MSDSDKMVIASVMTATAALREAILRLEEDGKRLYQIADDHPEMVTAVPGNPNHQGNIRMDRAAPLRQLLHDLEVQESILREALDIGSSL